MADRFPPLEEIHAGQTTTRDDAEPDLTADGTSGGDLLARERAALGDDAKQFEMPSDNMATVEDVDDDGDLLGGGDDFMAQSSGDVGAFETDFPAIDTQNEHMAPGGTITGVSAPYLPGAPDQSSSFAEPEEEPEVLREWREQRDLALQHRDEVSAGRKEQTIKAAQEAIDDFYENYNNKKEKGLAQTRREAEEFLANREDTSAGGTSWERIAKLVDLSGKGPKGGAGGSGKERFREVLLSLRKDDKAPGATGY